jgi:hypothetical protein
MLPNILEKYYNKIPKSRESYEFKELVKMWLEHNITIDAINAMRFLTQEEKIKALKLIGIGNGTFFEYFISGYDIPSIKKGEELSTLNQIMEYYKEPYMLEELKEKYPEASKRFIQFTSIEGGGSYFYDNQTDAVYDVTWGQEEDMINGVLDPWFTSFYDFLEWYYSEEEN